MLKSLVVGLDTTEAAKQAEKLGLSLARQHGAKIVGVSVIDVPYLTAPESMPVGGYHYKLAKDAHLMADAQRQSDSLLQQFTANCQQAGIAHEAMAYRGEPYAELLKIVDLHDLIVLGRDTSFHADDHDVMGSPVDRLVKHNPRPLIITPPDDATGSTVTIAYDGSVPAMRALQLYALLGLAVDHVHVVTIHADKARADALAERGRRFVEMHGIRAEAHGVVSAKGTADALLAEVRNLGSRLLVMGAFGHSGWREAILGSCTDTVLRESPIPVFVYH